MTRTNATGRRGEPPKTYAELSQLLTPRPIHGEAELDEASELINWLAVRDLNPDQADYLEALSLFVEAYEKVHWRIDTSHITPLDRLKFLLDENDMTGSDLGRLLGDRAVGSAILTGRRQLSKNHIRILCDRFKLDASAFLQTQPAVKPSRARRPRLRTGPTGARAARP